MTTTGSVCFALCHAEYEAMLCTLQKREYKCRLRY